MRTPAMRRTLDIRSGVWGRKAATVVPAKALRHAHAFEKESLNKDLVEARLMPHQEPEVSQYQGFLPSVWIEIPRCVHALAPARGRRRRMSRSLSHHVVQGKRKGGAGAHSLRTSSRTS